MKIYGYGVFLFLLLCSLVGFVLPKLFSAKSDTAFFIGVLILIVLPIVVYWMIKKLTQLGIKKDEKL